VIVSHFSDEEGGGGGGVADGLGDEFGLDATKGKENGGAGGSGERHEELKDKEVDILKRRFPIALTVLAM
jgi:hypothetical protein